MSRPKVVVIGGGFGGLNAVKHLKDGDLDIILVDRKNHHLFQPLLYQVATAALSAADIASPLRRIFRGNSNVTVLLDEAIAIDRVKRIVRLETGDSVAFDYLVVAPGSCTSYFGKEDWLQYAPGLKTLSDALEIRERILMSFEQAARAETPSLVKRYLTFVIVGAGPTGVELAGALAEIARKSVALDFPTLPMALFKVVLLEGGASILPTFAPELRRDAIEFLKQLDVDVRFKAQVTNVTAEGVWCGDTFIDSGNVIWAAGIAASPLLGSLETPLDRQGRVIVQQDLSIPDDPSIFVIGDAALFRIDDGPPLPALAPVALQQGRYVAGIIQRAMPPDQRRAFRYVDRGTMTTIGRAKAVAEIRGLRFSGFIAWVIWCVVHIFFLIEFRNRVRVSLEWLWYYVTFKPGTLLLYGSHRRTPREPHRIRPSV
jgi:NADH:ubiquinone reductase (H+-translocating)